jgi:hypothetical protein
MGTRTLRAVSRLISTPRLLVLPEFLRFHFPTYARLLLGSASRLKYCAAFD